MPLDSLMWIDEAFHRRVVKWELKFSLFPRKCHYSKKLLWFKSAYRGMGFLTGPGDPIVEYRWIEKNEFLIQRIKGTI